ARRLKSAVIPSTVDGSRRETLKVASTGSFDCARDDQQRLSSRATLPNPAKIIRVPFGNLERHDFRNIVRMQLAQPRFEFGITGRGHFENREYFRTCLHFLFPKIN